MMLRLIRARSVRIVNFLLLVLSIVTFSVLSIGTAQANTELANNWLRTQLGTTGAVLSNTNSIATD